MPVDQSGIHPIIDAIVNWQKLGQQEKDRKLDLAKQKEQERADKAREQQNKDELKAKTEQADRQYNIDKILSDAQRDLAYERSLGNLKDFAKEGGDLSKLARGGVNNNPEFLQQPTDDTGSYVETPSGQKIPLAAIPDYKKQQNIANEGAYGKAYNTTLGQETASAPFDEKKDARQAKIKQDLQNSENAFKMRIEQYQREGRSDEIDKEIKSRERIAAMNNATDRYQSQLALKAKMSSLDMFGENDNTIKNAINDVYITGNTKESAIPSKLRMGIKGAVPAGWTPLTSRDDEVFGNVQQMGTILDDAKLLAEIASYDVSPSGAAGAALGMFGDSAAIKRRVLSRAGELAKYFGKEVGVKTQKDIERAMEGAYSAYNNKKQNLEGVQKLQTVLDNAAQIVLKKYDPDQAKAILAKRGIDGTRFLGGDDEGGVPLVKTPEEFAKLKKGQKYMEEDGNVYVK